jgi:hypothetical protein
MTMKEDTNDALDAHASMPTKPMKARQHSRNTCTHHSHLCTKMNLINHCIQDPIWFTCYHTMSSPSITKKFDPYNCKECIATVDQQNKGKTSTSNPATQIILSHYYQAFTTGIYDCE